MKVYIAAVAGIAMTALAAATSAQNMPSANEILGVAASYLAAYAPRVSGITLEETYTMMDVSSGRMQAPVRLTSDLVVLNHGGTVITMRDPFAIDNEPLRPREPRITALLAKPTLEKWEQVQAYVNESVRRYPADLVVRASGPLLALQVLAPANQPRFAFTVSGRKRIGGIDTVVVNFKETGRKGGDYLFETAGGASAFGRIWIAAATGSIHRTELTLRSRNENAHIEVDYARDVDLDLWLPSAMFDDYTISQVRSGVDYIGAGVGYGATQKFQCRATYAHPRLTPIELMIVK